MAPPPTAQGEPPAEPLVINETKLDEKAAAAERLLGIPAAAYRKAVEDATAAMDLYKLFAADWEASLRVASSA